MSQEGSIISQRSPRSQNTELIPKENRSIDVKKAQDTSPKPSTDPQVEANNKTPTKVAQTAENINQNQKQDIQGNDPNGKETNRTENEKKQKTQKLNTKEVNQPAERKENSKLPKTKSTPDLTKYLPTEIPPFKNTSTSNIKTKAQNIEKETPQFIKSRKPPDQRLSIDPEQFRKTIQSFQELSNANEETAQQLYTEIRKAERHYVEVKNDYLKNTANPLFSNIKNKNKIPPSSTKGNTSTSSEILNVKQENISFNMGSSASPPPPTRKTNYKHPTPPHETSVTIEEKPQEDSVPEITQKKESTHKTRLLRSNSNSHTKL